jgi:hypothetical protein
MEAENSDWQGDFVTDYLLNYLDLGHDVIDKIGELFEYYNFANWSLD